MTPLDKYRQELEENKRLLIKYCNTLARKLAKDEDNIIASQDILDDDKRQLLGDVKLLEYLIRKLIKPYLTKD